MPSKPVIALIKRREGVIEIRAVEYRAIGNRRCPEAITPVGTHARFGRSVVVPKSILEAIKIGLWDFEPTEVSPLEYDRTDAMPGTKAKLSVLADRIRCGLPLWHPEDRDELDEIGVVDQSYLPGKPR